MPSDKKEKRRNSDGSEQKPKPQSPDQAGDGVRDQETTPAQERGERIDTGKSIARGGKDEGKVPGAQEQEPRH
jgi:hypothetical protein